jgi:uncharacterized protein (DUF2336 family)
MIASVEELERLAQERSSDKRRELLRALADRFFNHTAQPTSAELDLFDEIIERALIEIEPIARAELVLRMAELSAVPRRTLLALASDDIEIAGPLLTRSPALRDDDLVRIATMQSQGHLTAIARRTALSETVTDVLVRRGDPIVIETVTANRGAKFSDLSFNSLAERATTQDTLCRLLAARSDLPERIAEQVLPLLSAAVNANLHASDSDYDEKIRAMLLEETRTTLVERLRSSILVARSFEELLSLIDRELLSIDDAVIELADTDRAIPLAKLVGGRGDVREDTVIRALFARSEEPIMLICRAAGLSINAFSAVLRMRRRRRRGNYGSVGESLRSYSQLSKSTVDRVMQLVKMREAARRSA